LSGTNSAGSSDEEKQFGVLADVLQ
jgi:hypothetical protein